MMLESWGKGGAQFELCRNWGRELWVNGTGKSLGRRCTVSVIIWVVCRNWGQELWVNDVGKSWEGRYTCTAENSYGQKAVSAFVTIIGECAIGKLYDGFHPRKPSTFPLKIFSFIFIYYFCISVNSVWNFHFHVKSFALCLCHNKAKRGYCPDVGGMAMWILP